MVGKISNKAKISILGCGWLGIPLGKKLAKNGFNVKGSTTSTSKIAVLEDAHISPFLIGSDLDKSVLRDFLKAEILIVSTPPMELSFWHSMLPEIEKSTVSKVIFFSSTSVYEKSASEITELSQTKDNKLSAAEEYFINNPHFETTIIRFGGLIGPDRNPAFFFKNGKKIKNPKGPVNLIHQQDCIGIVLEIIKKESWGEIYNACSNSHPTKMEFYSKCALDFNQSVPLVDNESQTEIKIVSPAKIITKLGYNFVFNDLMNIATEN
ncbi:dTDP-glucose 4,6-dehydratase [Paracrocinitomix mangrovi]|uniref:dTDP-glucose 4,6-dehydratase n=1 Tax=Paracrocinitomix mangrovi TaxID=2862509 RepID=UPI001C8E22CA|nr:dTDP-glucose 4,6-dehydratase [Paracrocinitomix mangrovi]UKN00227.1 dTDP-glucose 4,6-dehydratase [Paracrocinitomix mangrovi]